MAMSRSFLEGHSVVHSQRQAGGGASTPAASGSSPAFLPSWLPYSSSPLLLSAAWRLCVRLLPRLLASSPAFPSVLPGEPSSQRSTRRTRLQRMGSRTRSSSVGSALGTARRSRRRTTRCIALPPKIARKSSNPKGRSSCCTTRASEWAPRSSRFRPTQAGIRGSEPSRLETPTTAGEHSQTDRLPKITPGASAARTRSCIPMTVFHAPRCLWYH